MCRNKRCDSSCANTCDSCSKQGRIYYCGVDIDCLNIQRGDDIHRAIKKIGDKICQIANTENPLTYVNIEEATEEQCPTGGVVMQILQVGSDNLVSEHILCNGSNFEMLENVSYEDLQQLISDSELIEGKFYTIEENGVTLQALNSNSVSTTGNREMRIVKPEYYVPATGILGVWYAGLTPSVNDVVVWGGRVWQNISGNVGASVDDLTLDSEWTLIPTSNDTYYQTKVFGCTYDLLNNWIASQWDDRGNVFTYSYQIYINDAATYNPLTYSDWGDTSIFDNNCAGILNNQTQGGTINKNSLKGLIVNNYTAGQIIGNILNNGSIIGNSIGGGIALNNISTSNIGYNTNTGFIIQNNCGTIGANSNSASIERNNCLFITNNSNLGEINQNSCRGIDNNSNNGGISLNNITEDIFNIGSANDNIQYNTNNGSISTTTTGDISDPVVNK